MILKGRLIAESPIYRGNARKTLFTRDGDGKARLVSLPGEISGTAQALMDAFTGQSRNGKNRGLFNQTWQRLFKSSLPRGLVQHVECKLQAKSYQRSGFFDLRMGIKLDEDRWAAEANANYKMETVFRNSIFDFTLSLGDSSLKEEENRARLYYILQEMKEGRFWFGAGKSKGLGNLRLEMEIPFSPPESIPSVPAGINHLRLDLTFDSMNPVLVGWNWGKIDPEASSFVAIEGRQLLAAMKSLPAPIHDRLDKALGGPIFNPEDWKMKFAQSLSKVIAIWLMEQSSGRVETWALPSSQIKKLGRGKHALSKKLVAKLTALADRSFSSGEEALTAIKEALGKKANMAKRVAQVLEHRHEDRSQFNREAWIEIAAGFGIDTVPPEGVVSSISDQNLLIKAIEPLLKPALTSLYRQIDQQIKLIQSDTWVDAEIKNREEHILIKRMLLEGKIDAHQWGRADQAPEGVSPNAWREFLSTHGKVQFRHMQNTVNLEKSIVNDDNLIEFLETYRDQTRQELAQPHHIDFRAGGRSNREISRKYGKPYDTMFMRMLVWSPSTREAGTWEIYIPGSTIKGAFRKRASQIMKTLIGETAATDRLLDLLFGTRGQRGLVFFSDAYLVDPSDPEKAWCSMDGVRMDPKTGRPIEVTKHDYLFAYGNDLKFRFRINIQDIGKKDMEAISFLRHLLNDFQRGDIPLGGEKGSGFGWVQADLNRVIWLTSRPDELTDELFGQAQLTRDGLWRRLELEGDRASEALRPVQPILPSEKISRETPPPLAKAGFISHRAFAGYCGMLQVEAEPLTPLSIRESGGPSYNKETGEGPMNGWDFFSLSPPDPAHRASERTYALPGRSIRGMIRHIYSIASDSRAESIDISRLNPSDSLFGWVGNGPNNALTGRVSFSFGLFDKPELVWFEVPYPYGEWQYTKDAWKQVPGGTAKKTVIDGQWRIFPHVPLAPVVNPLDRFEPKRPDASYFRAIMPGCRAGFTIRFWNLLEEELRRLVWCVGLEPGLAHKMGNNRYLGFGSLRLTIRPSSFLIDWSKRYAPASGQAWQTPLAPDEWFDTKVISNYSNLRKVLNAEQF
ncbi:MAG: hypothetical protein JRF51_16940 [Deltaproteobacteria bacterium]|nr:hypothetical protein [Deltaproteobacteria bacterium]